MLNLLIWSREQDCSLCSKSGPDDFNLCLKNNIPSLYTVDNSGVYTKEVPYFTNTHIFKADPIVIDKPERTKTIT